MLRYSLLCFAMMTALACVARGQVAISYSPTTLEPGVPTDLTMTLTDTSGDVVAFSAIILTFEFSDGLTLNGFSWTPTEFEDGGLWITSINLDGVPDDARPQMQATAFGLGLAVASSGSVDVALVNVTASASAAGTSQTITAVPVGSDATITDANVATLEVDSGATFTVMVGESSGGSGGSSGGGGSGGGPPNTDPGDAPTGGDGGTPGDAPTDTTNNDGTAPSDAGDATDAGAGPDPGVPDATAGDGDVVVSDPGADVPADGNGNGGGDTSPTGAANDSPGNTPAGDTAPSTTGTTPFCGLGMIGPGLFTFALLSVMKLHRRRRW